MQKQREVFQEIARVAAALAVCEGLMLVVYALAGQFTLRTLAGALVGFVLALGNFAALSITVSNAMDRAAQTGDAKKAQMEIQASSVVRLLILLAVYILIFRMDLCEPVSAILPLLFAQLSLKILEFFRKDTKGGEAAK